MDLLGVGSIVETVGKIAGDLVTTDKERMAADLQAYQAETDRAAGQVEVNKIEAADSSLFVKGWRPAVGWVGVAALAYQFLIYPFLCWGWTAMQAASWVPTGMAPPPQVDTDSLWVILSGILGLGAFRSAEKRWGVSK